MDRNGPAAPASRGPDAAAPSGAAQCEAAAEAGGDASLIELIRLRLHNQEIELSTFPVTAQRVLAECADPDCTLRAVENLVAGDPVIAAKVVQTANSSFYRGLKDVKTLSEAIMRLGLRNVRNIAVTAAMRQRLEARRGTAGSERLLRWRYAMMSAVTCRELARATGVCPDDEAFLGGLVHDIGSVFILESLERMAESDPRVAALDGKVLEEILQFLHEETGAKLLEQWKFPAEICGAVRFHHQPGEAEDGGRLVWVLAACEWIIRKIGFEGMPGDPDLSLVNLPPIQRLRLNDLELARLLVELEEKVQEHMALWA